MGAYDQFLLTKSQLDGDYGFRPLWMPDFLIDFQSAMVEWACRKGRRMNLTQYRQHVGASRSIK